MSSFTTGDSGYGKSLEKDSPNNNPSISMAGSCSQTWKNSNDRMNSNAEKFSSCLALTEETLSAHNRISHKHLKQHQRKNKSSMGHSNVGLKDSTWFQIKDLGHNKHKKHNRNLTVSTPTQTDFNTVDVAHLSLRCQPSTVPATTTDSHSTHMPQVAHPCLIPPSSYSGSAAAPFFIPGMCYIFFLLYVMFSFFFLLR